MTSLTRITIDPHHAAARADLADVNSLHKTPMRLVPDHNGPTPRATAGLLFRTEPGPGPILLVQTAHTADLTALPTSYGTAHTIDLTPLLNFLTPGRTMRYRITAAAPTTARSAGNPTPHPVTGKRRGKITHLTGDDAIAWWQRRATDAGLEPVTISSLPRPFPRTHLARSAPSPLARTSSAGCSAASTPPPATPRNAADRTASTSRCRRRTGGRCPTGRAGYGPGLDLLRPAR
ncbi:type I-E CRISPR-associated protein Cas6/Cse3/CasE [Streptomyces sp. NPDC087844]|uniref:type I-E CRISPR-associated protein Cas6/Cse3/CasE n=1 Tax=Streptomyces sp. NPDC087844 TaxID=3365805 RepID=UPI003800CB4C